MKIIIDQNYLCPSCKNLMSSEMVETNSEILLLSCLTNLNCPDRYKVYEVELDFVDAVFIEDKSE